MNIARLQLGYLKNRIKERGFTLSISDKALAFLAEKGYDPNFGARPLKRVIQNQIETPLAKEIIGGSFKEGDVVSVDSDGRGLKFRKKRQDVSAAQVN
jgi:ATP-dependent Clp protease ATP-binding subunit ClpB